MCAKENATSDAPLGRRRGSAAPRGGQIAGSPARSRVKVQAPRGRGCETRSSGRTGTPAPPRNSSRGGSTIIHSGGGIKVDYAASVWCSPNKHNVIARWIAKPLSMTQRIVCQAIVGCYKTVALQIAEAEAGIEPVLVRLRKRVLKHWVQCHTLPRSHPFWMCRNAVANQRRRHLSPFKLLELLCPEPTPWMEVIEPAEGEWQSLNDRRPQITLEPLHDLGLERRPNQARIWLFTHSVQRNDKVGSGLVIDVHQRTIMSCAGLAGDSANTNVHLASLLAIHDALDRVKSMLPRIGMAPSHIQVVACTSDRASLQALDHPARPQSGQEFRLAIMRLAGKLIDQGLQIQIRWTPKESNFGQLRRASALALQATQDDNLRGAPTQMAPATWRQVCERLDKQAKEEFESANVGQRTRNIDAALLGKHTKSLYDSLSRPQAALLVQLRTGHIRLNRFLQRAGHLESNACGCGDDGSDGETVEHFLFQCPRWGFLRQEMRTAMGSRYGDISYALGGRSRVVGADGKPIDREESWKPNLPVVREVLWFVESTGRLGSETR